MNHPSDGPSRAPLLVRVVDRAEQLREHANHLVAAAGDLADHLVGPVPLNTTEPERQAAGLTFAERLLSVEEDIGRALGAIEERLSRITNEMPPLPAMPSNVVRRIGA